MRGRVLVVVALALLAAAPALAQKPPTPQQKKAAKAHFQQGKAFYEAGAWDDAIREYQKAHDLVPLPDLMFNIGQAWRMKGDKAKALEAYQKYLDRLPDGPLADEARNHVASLKLKMQVEEAEAARKKALEEAAAARRRADEEAAARRRAEEEAAARAKTQTLDEERFRRLSAEEAERQRRQRIADEAALQRRVDGARTRGGWSLRLAGNLTIAAGCVVIASMMAPLVLGSRAGDKLKQFDGESPDSYTPWTTSLDDAIKTRDAAKVQLIALAATGATLLIAGGVIYAIGSAKRGRAVEAAKAHVSVAPLVGPSTAALGVGGRF
ncbi:MAG: tetratricopeptide repeat protein [Deltaproteobacteria bacterium]|nr:tetratricopeptide repeat protein [Deltaproteobacteria bacterium]